MPTVARLWRLVVVFVMAALLAACPSPVVPVPPTNTPVPRQEVEWDQVRENCVELSKKGRARQGQEEEGLLEPPYQDLVYVQSQLVVGGPPEAVTTAFKDLGLAVDGESGDLTMIREPIPAGKEGSLELQLYQLAGSLTVEEVTCVFAAYARVYPDSGVFAEPNYFMSPAAWSGGGSPWTQNGKWAMPGGGLGSAPSDAFRKQWAFGPQGIDLFDANQNRKVRGRGEKVAIAILDTSPIDEPLAPRRCPTCDFDAMLETAPGVIEETTPPFVVWNVIPASASAEPSKDTCPGPNRTPGEPDHEGQELSSHGLFVAGLAQAVAPDSQIYLIRVLQDDACGNLYTVAEGLERFRQEMISKRGEWRGAVVNLSLGVHQPPNPSSFSLPDEVTSLQLKVQDLIEEGAVVVAASGNDSFDCPWAKEEEIPARDSQVISVAASTIEQRRGCFSNQGDVAAPGGDGVKPGEALYAALAVDEGSTRWDCEVPGRLTPEPGVDAPDAWSCQQDDRYCVVSMVKPTGHDTASLAYWTGTSFAAPLASGLAALLLESGVPPQLVVTRMQARATAAPGESLGAGIVKVAGTVQ